MKNQKQLTVQGIAVFVFVLGMIVLGTVNSSAAVIAYDMDANDNVAGAPPNPMVGDFSEVAYAGSFDIANDYTWEHLLAGYYEGSPQFTVANSTDDSGTATDVDFQWNINDESFYGIQNANFLQQRWQEADDPNVIDWQFTGLVPGYSYTLDFFQGNGGTQDAADVTITGVGTQTSDGLITFSDIIADGSGIIAGTWNADVSAYATTEIYGIAISGDFIIPEPSTIALFALPLVGLLLRRRRRSC